MPSGHCVVWKPQFEVLIEQDELHCRATGVFGIPAPLRGLVEAISHVIPRLFPTRRDTRCKRRLGDLFRIEERIMRQVSFTSGT